jgi:hypothetical protein
MRDLSDCRYWVVASEDTLTLLPHRFFNCAHISGENARQSNSTRGSAPSVARHPRANLLLRGLTRPRQRLPAESGYFPRVRQRVRVLQTTTEEAWGVLAGDDPVATVGWVAQGNPGNNAGSG